VPVDLFLIGTLEEIKKSALVQQENNALSFIKDDTNIVTMKKWIGECHFRPLIALAGLSLSLADREINEFPPQTGKLISVAQHFVTPEAFNE
jgi:hypothetical protein